MNRYLEAAAMTAAGEYAPLLADLPQDIAALAAVSHGVMIHEHLADAYGVTLTSERRASVHLRPVAALLGQMMAEDSRPLTVARDAVAMLRAQGTPARARCGFGTYFGTGGYEDHWVCEYWDQDAGSWKLADFQIDDVQLKLFDVGFDLMDVPRDSFLVAGDAWRMCREGRAEPD